ncbi:signal peptidase I [Haloferula luteola]|uniref:Signal peptidase I n=1 Tax=Haloferula luteola TaxID=595692 RepID=A0A840UXG4_9BACT|nr:signal peptidase I [Haloferula luteola]MBB5350462.1 signal peptidase I [Haloferula luteola]
MITLFDVVDFIRPNFLLPGWKKEAKHLRKGAKKFIHYKRDLLSEDRIAEIESRRADLKEALQRGDRQATEEAGRQLQDTCERATSKVFHQTWWEENLEVIFVALVVALGLRTYVVQPFRIPTGSMQPTLNGIVIRNEGADFKAPWIGQQVWDFVFKGKRYYKLIADADKQAVDARDASWFLFTRTEVTFSDGSKEKIPAAGGEVGDLMGFRLEQDPLGRISRRSNSYRKGDAILNGSITSGDLVLVDRISYHFRQPKRGEVFVFDTRGLPTGGDLRHDLASQSGGSHYIKRLCGVPGDALSIDEPDLLNHGEIVQAPGIRRVADREGVYAVDYDGHPRRGYHLADKANATKFRRPPLIEPGDVFELKESSKQGMSEYAALGDNTGNSLDSRFWGPVHEFNLVGPGWVSLWPFGSGHWGRIK